MKFSQIRVANLKNPQTILSIVLQITIILLAVVYPLLFNPQKASAATEAFVMFDRISGTSPISGWACMKSGNTTQTNVVLVFPAGWTVSQTASNWTETTANLPADPQGGSVAAWPSIASPANSVSGLSVVYTGGVFSSATTLYCFHFAGASSTMTVGDNQTGQLKTQGGNPYVDSYNWAVSIVSSNGEQVTVNASVSATMQFSLGSNTISLGTLSSSTTTSGNAVATITTNARNGWVTWLQAANGSASAGWLHSTTANANIATGGLYPTTYDLASVTGYVVAAIASTGTTDPAYATTGAGGTNGGLTSTQLRQLAYNTNAETAANTVTVYARAKIASTQPAATDYTDTLTIVAAGSF